MRNLSYKRIVRILMLTGFLLPLAASAAVSQVSFTTDPQSIEPGVISGTMTIQLQDSSGSSAQAAETMDVEFLSSSPTGEFLSPTSDKAVTTTISTGSANKNFRYRDSAEGKFTLTANVKGRTSGTAWSTSQAVTVSSSGSASSTGSEPGSSSSGQSDASGPSSGSGSSAPSSVHYSSVAISSMKPSSSFELSAGEDRLGTVGSPLEFEADMNTDPSSGMSFKWSFGDGTADTGLKVAHTYRYPGDYVVMLNAFIPSVGKAVARADVKVVDPKIEVSYADRDKIEIRNGSNQEISLFGRALVSGGGSFVFPQDTIMKPGASVALGSGVTHLYPERAADVAVLALGSTEPDKLGAQVEEAKRQKIAEIQDALASLESRVASARAYAAPAAATAAESAAGSDSSSPEASNTASAVESLSQQDSAGQGWIATIKRFFLRNN